MLDLSKSKRIVVKAGTSILSSRDGGGFSQRNLEKLGSEIAGLIKKKKEVVLVTSGAIALGMAAAGLKERPTQMSRLQACAAVGQGKLMHAYEQFFAKRGIHTAQLLLTRDGLENKERFLLAREALKELLRMKVLPIVNENDTVATEEIAFGDNDILSVHVAQLTDADLLVILSDVDGFHLKDNSRVKRVSSAREIDETLIEHLRDRQRQTTVGGMKAKLAAARVAMRLEIPMLLVNGHEDKILQKVISGEDVGTLFFSNSLNST